MMLHIYLSLAMRNLQRNAMRTGLTLFAFVVGIGALTFLAAMNDAWMLSMKNNFILTQTGDLQIHHQGFEDQRKIKDNIDPQPVLSALQGEQRIRASSLRIRATGLASVARASTGVNIIAVQPQQEQRVSRLASFVVKGAWLTDDDPRALLLGITLAEHLSVELGDKIILMTQSTTGDLVSEVFRLRGILRAGNPDIDKTMAIIHLTTAQRWLGLGQHVTDVVIRAQQHRDTEALYNYFSHQLAAPYEVTRWYDVAPTIREWIAFSDVYTYIILMIVVVIVLAEALNTMLMSMHERIREFGLMEALGTKKLQIFYMMQCETMVLVLLGGGVGYAIGALLSLYYGHVGIDLSSFADAFTFVYMSSVVYPVLSVASAMKIVGTCLLAASVAGLYPAWKATRLQPVEAMRDIS